MSGKKIGGEYGQVRANIDTTKLNEYLAKHVGVIQTPVDIKQFKVCGIHSIWRLALTQTLLALCSLDRCDMFFGHV